MPDGLSAGPARDGDELAGALVHLREMAALLDPSSLQEPWQAGGEEAAEGAPELFVPRLVAAGHEAEDLEPEPRCNGHVADLARVTESWALPKLRVEKPRIRRLPAFHLLSDAAYQPIALTARALSLARSGVPPAAWYARRLAAKVGRGLGALIGMAARAFATAAAVPLAAVAHLDVVGVLALLFALTGVVIALSLALR